MVRGRGSGVAATSPSRKRHTASTRRRRRVDSASEATDQPMPDTEAPEPEHASSSFVAPLPDQPSDQPHSSQPSTTDIPSECPPQQSEDDDISMPLPGGPRDRSILKSFKNHVAFAIYAGEERGLLKCRAHGLKISECLLDKRIHAIVIESSLSPLIDCTYKFANPTIVSAFTERWQPETNTFFMSFGEMTITLYDVSSILKIPVTGRPLSIPHLTGNEARDLLSRLLGVSLESAAQQIVENRGPFVKLEWLKKIFMNVADSACSEEIQCASRAYLLFLLGCTLFVDKSGTLVPVAYLTLLDDLSMVHSYAWGAACLAFLYRQLGIASRREVKSICGYLTLLEAWVYEHFQFTRVKYNLSYTDEQPRALRWLSVRDTDTLQSVREQLDELSPDQVIWMPYRKAREHHPMPEITFFSGCLKCGSIIEPYHPERVLRQFGHVQDVPPPPLSPIEAKRGVATTSYRVIYPFIDDSWNRWDFHVLPPHRRGRRTDWPWHFTEQYLSYYGEISHGFIQNPIRKSKFDRGGNEIITIAEARNRLSLLALSDVIPKYTSSGSGEESVSEREWKQTCLALNVINSTPCDFLKYGYGDTEPFTSSRATTSRTSEPQTESPPRSPRVSRGQI